MTAPTPAEIHADIAHVEAAILGIEDGVRIRAEREAAGKRTDGMGGFRAVRLAGFRHVLVTLQWALGEVERRS